MKKPTARGRNKGAMPTGRAGRGGKPGGKANAPTSTRTKGAMPSGQSRTLPKGAKRGGTGAPMQYAKGGKGGGAPRGRNRGAAPSAGKPGGRRGRK